MPGLGKQSRHGSQESSRIQSSFYFRGPIRDSVLALVGSLLDMKMRENTFSTISVRT